MRFALALCLLSSPALSWDFTPGIPCILRHDTGAEQVELIYDPTGPLYTITISRADALPVGDVFSMRFDGPAGLSISTRQHRMGDNGTSVTVTDRGFGNVLNGLQFNQTATAIIGDTEISFPLADAADAVAAFRACDVVPAV